MLARHKPLVRNVVFATEDGECETLEGTVRYHAGDAIVTGERGERWPVGRARFLARYRSAGGTVAGEDGRYVSAAREVVAIRIGEPTELVLDGGTLVGEAGDWLLDYGDGSRGVVRGDIFAATYDVLEVAPE